MENPANYTSLIQLAVTFNFIFVVFRHQSEDKAKMLIDTLIEKWRTTSQEEMNAIFTAIQEMVNNKLSFLTQNPVIKKYHEELKSNYDTFNKLISWYPRYLPRYCLMSGLYSLALLTILAELNFDDSPNHKIHFFLSFLVICQIFYNGYYIVLETNTAFQEKQQHEQKYMWQLISFTLIVIIGVIAAFCGLEFNCAKELFYPSIILAFSPFLITYLYIIVFGITCIIKLQKLISQIEAFRIDFNNAVMGYQTGTYEYITESNNKSFEFCTPEDQ